MGVGTGVAGAGEEAVDGGGCAVGDVWAAEPDGATPGVRVR
jgi:hypothetical protein